MAIVAQCGQCGKKFQAPDSFAGKRAKCSCGAVIEVPGAAAAAPQEKPRPQAPRKDLPKPEPKSAILPKTPKPAAAPKGEKHPSAVGARGAHARRPRGKSSNTTTLIIVGVAAVVIGVGLIFATKYHAKKVEARNSAAAAATQAQAAAKAGTQPVQAPPIDPLTLVPADVKGLGFVNLKQVAATGVLDSFAAALGAAAVEIDLTKNVETAAIAYDGDSFGSANAVIISGKFRESTVLAKCLIADPRYPAMTYERDYKIRATRDGSKAVSVIEGRVLVLGTLTGVQKVIEVYRRNLTPIAAGSPLLARGKALAGKAFWFTTDSLPSTVQKIGGLDLSQAKKSTASSTLTDKGMGLNVTVAFATGSIAKSVAGQLKALVEAFAPAATVLVGGDESTLAVFTDVVKDVKIAANGTDVAIDASLSLDLIGKMKTLKVTLLTPQVEKPATEMSAPPKLDEKEKPQRPKDDFDF